MTELAIGDRRRWLERSKHLQWLTVGWNAVEAVIAIAAAIAAGSVALMAFGLDSIVEMSSGLVILWRIGAERRARSAEQIDRVEKNARRAVAVTLYVLGAFIVLESSMALINREEPGVSPVGMALLLLSVAVMWWLAREKRVVAARLHSHAMEADAAQTNLCMRLSLTALAGLALNAAFGWWWADPIAAIGVAVLVFLEARRAWQQKPCCG
jgi:divalent metal cation (Fe/Co/Zn/Cd) transporter